MKWQCYILILLPLFSLGQQNLVPNTSFEESTDCPSSGSQFHLVNDWINPNQASPDYFHSCATQIYWGTTFNAFGSQVPHSGNAYVGGYSFSFIQPDIRDYIQVELTSPLEQGKSYIVSFYTSVADNGLYGIGTMGAYLSVDAITSNDVYRFDVMPQVINDAGPLIDSTAWVLVTDTFVSPLGGERYLTIGNFNTDATSDTVRYNPTGDVSYVYAYYYIDDVSVVALDGPVGIAAPNLPKDEGFGVYPNPNSGQMTVTYTLSEGEIGKLDVFDILGQQILSQRLMGEGSQITVVTLPDNTAVGLYSFTFSINGIPKVSEKVSIFKE